MKYTKISILLALITSLFFVSTATAKAVKVKSCAREVVFTKTPTRAVSHDINMTQMMFALGLQSKMAGFSGVTGWQKLTDEFKQQAKGLPQIAPKYASIENLLAVNADFFFAGWNYGMRPGGQLTPNTLEPFGIKVYELTESCIHITQKTPSHFNDVYQDIRNLGTIFKVEDKAEKLIAGFERDLNAIKSKLDAVKKPVKVFLYDSGKDAPFTAGLYAMPNAMIEAAGGTNILSDLKSSWAKTNWELVVERNPEWIVIVDYGQTTAKQKIDFLLHHPALKSVNAIINKRFVVITYEQATPSVKNVAATTKLAKAFYPHKFKQ